MSMESYIEEIVEILKKDKKMSKERLSKLKVRLCKKHKVKKIPTDIEIMMHADEKDAAVLKKTLLTKPTRTISGVSVIALMTKPRKCLHGACIMCPSKTDQGVPQSYTGKEPATRRAIRNRFDPYLQVFNRLEQYVAAGHSFDKIELIIMGGTFPSYPKKYKEDFVAFCFKAMNDFSRLFFKGKKFNFIKFKEFFELPGDINDKKRQKSIHYRLAELKKSGISAKKRSANSGKGKSGAGKSKAGRVNLKKEQQYNAKKSKIKCVGLTIETRSDYATLRYANEMLRLGCTRVELGIQSVYEDVLRKMERGHSVQDNIDAIKTLKDLGFKINFHYMLGLPGSSPKKDLEGLMELFENEDYRPDMLKIYPCMVVKDSKLYKIWKKRKFRPLSTKKAAKLIAEFKPHIPPYCRIMRVQRDIPTFMTEAGVDRTNLRQYVEKIMKKNKTECGCIRCREIGRAPDIKKLMKKEMKIQYYNYNASVGNEFFIPAEIDGYLLGFCRLRFPYQSLRKEITHDSALIRELHVYGQATEIGAKGATQHKGIGKKLLKRAEEIAKTYYKKKMVVISGVGARNYYRKLGYKKEGPYMVKRI